MVPKLKIRLKRGLYKFVKLSYHRINPNSALFNLIKLIHKKTFLPYILKIHVNNKCNLNNCRYCYLKKDNSSLKIEKLLNIVDQASELSFYRLEILGGEPLLRKDIPHLIRYAKKNKKIPQMYLYTNATLITQDLAKKLKNSGLDMCIVGLDSLSEKNRIKGIKKLVKAGIKTRVFTAITSKNINQLKQINLLSKSLGAKSYFFRYIPKDNDPLSNISNHKWQSVLSWLIKNKGKNYWKIISRDIKLHESLCCGGISVISITSKGDVTPCPFVDYKLGNIYEESIEEIISKINLKNHKEFMGYPSECNDCELLKICGGGCKAVSKNFYGDYLRKDPYCKGPYKGIDLNNLEAYLPHWDR